MAKLLKKNTICLGHIWTLIPSKRLIGDLLIYIYIKEGRINWRPDPLEAIDYLIF